MCGRFVCISDLKTLQRWFDVDVVKAEPEASYNVAPTQWISAVVQNMRGTRGLVRLRWGLIPPWAKDRSGAARMINARLETAAEKPSFAEALRQRRCLIPANGFYEWPVHQQAQTREPVYIQQQGADIFAFAGLYSFWRDPDSGEQLATCSILTTAANRTLADLHHRMPVILKPRQYAAWLDKHQQNPTELQALCQGLESDETTWHKVSESVNKVSYNQQEAIQPV
ncbi:MAG: SOS response-associated peptidase [Candidatus Sericytochromatia bacterium]|nr:SOS response-associated peptidase [Candidatus Sericytochromatia bacterium]